MPTLPQLDPDNNANYSSHVVICGAGASIASLPNGDKNGRRLPVMKNLVQVLDLQALLSSSGVTTGYDDFEALYDSLVSDPAKQGLCNELESRVHSYFAEIQIPDDVTIYDELLLQLRAKDVVATFNWDPLLLQAYRRVADLGNAPHILFLHGNVAVAFCEKDRMTGNIGDRCIKCRETLTPTPLLFPVGNKDYRTHPYLSAQWQALEQYLSNAFILTIFGYSAPTTDANARDLMRAAWTANTSQDLAEIEIVDIRPEPQLLDSWKDFIVRQHYTVWDRLENTLMYKHPRRSCDAFAGAILEMDPWTESRLGHTSSLADLRAKVGPIIQEEVDLETRSTPFKRGPV